MSYGKPEYNNDGHIKCEICGKYFTRVVSHVRQKHDMNEREYKLTYGFDLTKGLVSPESKEKSRQAALRNYNKVIAKNLLDKGVKTRFKVGTKGRTKDMVFEQTRIALKERLNQPYMQEAMKKSGQKLGLSGLRLKKKRINL